MAIFNLCKIRFYMSVKSNVLGLTTVKVNRMYELVCVLKISELIGKNGDSFLKILNYFDKVY